MSDINFTIPLKDYLDGKFKEHENQTEVAVRSIQAGQAQTNNSINQTNANIAQVNTTIGIGFGIVGIVLTILGIMIAVLMFMMAAPKASAQAMDEVSRQVCVSQIDDLQRCVMDRLWGYCPSDICAEGVCTRVDNIDWV